MGQLYQFADNPDSWSDSQLLTALTMFGWNLHGNFILGEAKSLQDFRTHQLRVVEEFYKNTSPATYPKQARLALEEDEAYGSSAGGEQPKFTSMVCDQESSVPRAVIVKFSPTVDTPAGQRWADLLYAEHISNEVLSGAGFHVADTQALALASRVFLESSRFDREGAVGRRSLISLRSLDAAYLGIGQGTWAKAARALYAQKWISEEDRHRMIQLQCFGELIGNTDMHWGNLSFVLNEKRPISLAPIYDMLPMFFRPTNTSEVPTRTFKPTLPNPENQKAWIEMHPHATAFWYCILDHSEISHSFKEAAKQALEAIAPLPDIFNAGEAR